MGHRSVLVIDGQATVMALGMPEGANKAAKRYDRVDVTFDQYSDISI